MEHDIILDLLPLYHDGVCSEASRREVEAHLKTCRACSKVLADMDMPLAEAGKRASDDAAAVKRISREWRRGWWRAWAKGAAIALAVCLLVFGGWYAATQIEWLPVPTERIEITNVRQLSDGRLLYHLYIKDDLDLAALEYQDDGNGTFYIVPKRALYTQKRRVHSLADWDFELSVAEENAWRGAADADHTDITAVYCGRGKNAVLIWEEGMDLPAASAEEESQWGITGA